MRKIIEYIKSTSIIIILLILFNLIAIITFIDYWLIKNYDINTGWEQFILANGLEWLMIISVGLFIFTLPSIGVYFFISLMRVPVEKDDYTYNSIRTYSRLYKDLPETDIFYGDGAYGDSDYNELPDIIKLEILSIRRYVEFPKGEKFCIHCKNLIEIGDWYRSPCLCYNCQITSEKPPKEFRNAQLRKWKKDKKKALELEKEYIKKLDKNYHLKTKLVRINSLGNRLGLLSGNPRYNRYTSLWIMLAIFILLVILSRISP